MLTIPNSPRYNAVFWSKFFSPSYFSTFQEAINLSFHFESEFDFFTNQNEKQQIFELRILKYNYSNKKLYHYDNQKVLYHPQYYLQ